MEKTNGEILFADKFLDLINESIKTTTVRSGVRNYVPGLYDMYNPDKTIHMYVNITGTEYKTFGELDDGVAKTDGFADAAELKNELLSFYPDLTDDSPVTVVYLDRYCGE